MHLEESVCMSAMGSACVSTEPLRTASAFNYIVQFVYFLSPPSSNTGVVITSWEDLWII